MDREVSQSWALLPQHGADALCPPFESRPGQLRSIFPTPHTIPFRVVCLAWLCQLHVPGRGQASRPLAHVAGALSTFQTSVYSRIETDYAHTLECSYWAHRKTLLTLLSPCGCKMNHHGKADPGRIFLAWLAGLPDALTLQKKATLTEGLKWSLLNLSRDRQRSLR